MIVLRKGMKGIAVGKWQYFLHGIGLYSGIVDDDFGGITEKSTILFQKKNKLFDDGVVGRQTYALAVSLGFGDMQDEENDSMFSENFPPKPDVLPLKGIQKEQLFGKIEYVAKPTAKNLEAIKITNNFEKDNIIMVVVPQLKKVCGGKYYRMRIHKSIKYQMLQMWKEWEKEGLLDFINSYGGTYIARFIRGSRTHLSNHAYGTAMDINMKYNRLGATPALVGKKGSVRLLIMIANKWGFYWGGHYKSRKDGMHLEAYKIIPKP